MSYRTGRPRRTPPNFLANPDLRLGLGLAGMTLSGLPVHQHSVGPREEALFRAVNGIPDGLHLAAWLIMQSGSLAAAPAAATLAWGSGRPRLALRLGLGGLASWALSKAVKRVYRRPRPGSLVAGARTRGAEASGLGYVSGHAGVAVALDIAAFPELGPAGRLATLLAVPAVGLCRIYVGAHLPLDVAGGAAMGLAVDGVLARILTGVERCLLNPT